MLIYRKGPTQYTLNTGRRTFRVAARQLDATTAIVGVYLNKPGRIFCSGKHFHAPTLEAAMDLAKAAYKSADIKAALTSLLSDIQSENV